jgi:hypothetical protein
MDFVQSLRPEHLQSFWYSASKYCFALIGTFISLLWATSLDKEEANVYKTKLDEYRWTLRLSSRSADFLDRAISMLATSTGVLVKAIPETPNLEAILNRRNTRLTRTSAFQPQIYANNAPRHQSQLSAHSESEFHEETSPEQLAGETPLSSGAASAAWNVDNMWYASGAGDINTVGAVYTDPGGDAMADAYYTMPASSEHFGP